jgi:hypothetical protein
VSAVVSSPNPMEPRSEESAERSTSQTTFSEATLTHRNPARVGTLNTVRESSTGNSLPLRSNTRNTTLSRVATSLFRPEKKVGQAPGLLQSFKAVVLGSCTSLRCLLGIICISEHDKRAESPARVYTTIMGVSLRQAGFTCSEFRVFIPRHHSSGQGQSLICLTTQGN